jgi:hypothetical protein
MKNETFAKNRSRGAPARREILTFVMSLGLAFCPLTLPAQSVTIAWTPNPSNTVVDVAGYMLYYGYNGTSFPNHVNAGTNTSVTVNNLPPGTMVYFEVETYNSATISPPSTPIEYFVTNSPNPVTNIVSAEGPPTVLVSNGTFTVGIVGQGTLSPHRNAQAYQTGGTYTLTATAARGSVFANWVSNGIVAAATPRYTFLVEPNMVLQANFITNPFIPAVGTYHGLFCVTNDATEENSGSFIATVTSSGAFSARLHLGARTYAYSEKFSVAGLALQSIPRPGLSPITVQLQLDLSNGPMTGTISDGSWTADLVADPAVYSRAHPAPQAGKYTLLLPGSTNAAGQPGGNGFGAVTVNDSGTVTFSGTLGDGTPVTSTSVVSSQGLWPFYASLYGGNGSILGWFSLTNNSTNNLSGQAGWFKLPQTTAKLYPGGFTSSIEVIGSVYQYTNGLPVLGATADQLSLTSGNLPQSITNQVVLGPNNEATATTTNKLTFKTASGLFKGSVINPETGQPISVNGIVLQDQNVGAGFFLGATESGSVLLSPMQ